MADAGTAAAPAQVDPDWLSAARNDAKTRGAKLALPGPKDKGWEFTDLSDLDFDAYTDGLALVEGIEVDAPEGVVVKPLAEAAADHADLVRERLGSLADPE